MSIGRPTRRRSKPETRKHRVVVLVDHQDMLKLKSTLALRDLTISAWLRKHIADAIADEET